MGEDEENGTNDAKERFRKRTVSDFALSLEHESYAQNIAGPDPEAGKDRGSACGVAGRRSEGATCRQFALVLQDMLKQCLCAPQSFRIRIFDDYRSTVTLEEGTTCTFSESRCTAFRRLRAASGIAEDAFRDSMCAKPFLGGETEASGKSGSLFLRSHDECYVMKTIEEHEFQVLKEILPNYVLYLEENTNSLLCRFFGAYSLQLGDRTLRFVVMANVLQHKALQIYDLKGTTEDRWVNPEGGKVLKDLNFMQHKILLEAQKAKILRQCIRDDAEFLESIGLMDYSMLVGVSQCQGVTFGEPVQGLGMMHGWLDTDGEEPVERAFQLGIIDYLQRWTPKKVAAHWLKKPTIGCCHEIDTEPPAKYCSRFFKYFVDKVQEKTS